MEYYAESIHSVLAGLGTTENGLSSADAGHRLAKHGPNEFKKKRRASVAEIFINQFRSLLVIILLAAIVISVVLGENVNAIVIAAIVVFNAGFGTYQEYRAERAMEALERMASPTARVLRDGKVRMITSRNLVPGDIVLLETGDAVPADTRIIESMNLRCDEAALTGESLSQSKGPGHVPAGTTLGDRKSMAYMSTIVSYGRGRAVVTATGMETELGRIAQIIETMAEAETPMQKRLAELGSKLGTLILAICAVIFMLEAAKRPELLGHVLAFRGDLSLLASQLLSDGIAEPLLVAVSLAVSAMPEGLPAVVTITLALGLQRMARRNAVVRQLPSVETLGSTTVICTDKTGTLTRNEMTVTRLFVNNGFVEVTGSGYAPTGSFSRRSAELHRLLEIGAHCNNAELVHDGKWDVIGDPTEGCLLTLAAKGGVFRLVPRLDELPFDSTRKRMTTIHDDGSAFMKGAPESVLPICDRMLVNGRVVKLTAKDRDAIHAANSKMASSALRVLAFAYRELPRGHPRASAEANMVFVGLAGMIDPPRTEARDAIAQARQAGIRVVMITGDNALTAKAIAVQLGLATQEEDAVTGEELDRLGAHELPRLAREVAVFARVSPEHKLAIVQALKDQGEVVAVTGDGVNDAPALKTADIGVSMGITGTDVSKEASDIVLADDNFATLIAAVEEGRRIYQNVRNSIKYLLSANFGEIVVVASSAIVGLPLPFIPVQILWINLVTDGFPALALGMEPSDPGVMKHKPRPRDQSMFHGILDHMVMAGALAAAVTFVVFVFSLPLGLEKARTLAFTTIVMFELLFALNCRSPRHSLFGKPFENKWLVLALAASFCLQLVVIYVPGLNALFGTVPLGLGDWLVVLGASSLALLPFLGDFWKKG